FVDDLVDRHVDGGGGSAGDELHHAGGSFFTYGHAVGDSNQIGIFKFDAGTLVSVIEQDVNACCFEGGCDGFAGLFQGGIAHVRHGNDDGEGGNARREPEAVGVIGLLDGGGEDALDADAVAAHDGSDFFAVGVEDAGAHHLGVAGAKLEDVPHFDGFADDEAAGAVGRGAGFAFVDGADVGGEGPLEIAAGDDVAEVVVELVGSADE